ncbi:MULTISPECIES: hypothetical protein [Bacillus]|nr:MULTISPECIES: hypothetical protein [Bacillus]KZD28283.1 hypothetical protein B4083_5252 [Bacillus cereus]MCQ6526980.1 hypothetical protein [Bacillus mycoides]MED1283184.1 hypothetical protein [Bacillus mycoides]
MTNLPASVVTKERSISREYDGLKIVCIDLEKLFKGEEKNGIDSE